MAIENPPSHWRTKVRPDPIPVFDSPCLNGAVTGRWSVLGRERRGEWSSQFETVRTYLL